MRLDVKVFKKLSVSKANLYSTEERKKGKERDGAEKKG